MKHWVEILFAFLVVGCHAATPNLPLYVRPDGTVSGPSNFFTGALIAGPNITLTTQRTNVVITSMGSGATVTNIAGGTNISIRATGGTNFIDTTGQLNNWSQIPTNTIPSTVAAASNTLYLAILANGSLVSNGCVAFTMTTSNNLVSLIGSSTNYHNLNGTNFTSKHATISSNLTITGYAAWGVGGDKMRTFLSTNGGGSPYFTFYGEASAENLQVDWVDASGIGGSGIKTPNVKSSYLFVSNGVYVSYGGSMNPVGAYGSLMMNSTNIVVCAGVASVYTNVAGTGFTTIVTNGFYGNTVGNSAALTNIVAGWYRVAINISMLGQGNQATEGELFTNGVACDSVGFKKTFDAAARMDSTGANGIIYLPAGTRSDFRIQDAGTGGSISIHRASLVIGTP